MTEKKYHVGCGAFGIYAGTVKANGEEWKDKSDCTEEVIEAVRDYLVQECLGGLNSDKTTGGYSWKLKDGRTVKLVVEIEEE